MSIYVGNLSYEVRQEDLAEVFAEYGTVKSIQGVIVPVWKKCTLTD